MKNSNENSAQLFTVLFKDPINAEQAYNLALQSGYKKEDINVFMSEETKKKNYVSDNLTTNSTSGKGAKEGAEIGGAIGTTVGGITAAVLAIGTSFIIPGLSLVIAGPLAAGIAGAGAGGITGGIIGALIGSGISENYAKEYEEGIKKGGVVLGVKINSEDERKNLANVWKSFEGTKLGTESIEIS